jgi:protein-arginine kinase activator protein McsA
LKCRRFRAIASGNSSLITKKSLAFQEIISCPSCNQECEETITEKRMKCDECSVVALKAVRVRKETADMFLHVLLQERVLVVSSVY